MSEFKFDPNYLVMGNWITSCELKFPIDNISVPEYTIAFFKSQHMEISEIKNDGKFICIVFTKNDN